ncbi:hypothetical protein DY000_02033896 [Brassica cretica]|uniref:Uncharacterized protein n=1 Tax=Brassica cretica TaxID=69181 RepID=A0ABQ7DQR6_BRACR|nr:hypothetical protein DY000_02033896 [Brassica cretica]
MLSCKFEAFWSFLVQAREDGGKQLQQASYCPGCVERWFKLALVVSIGEECYWKSVPKKKGRLVGLGRRSRSVPPFSAPPPFVDPEVLTAQLKDKDDRISLLETQMASQHAGYEAQKRLNQKMMEMMKRMYPNEVFPNVQDP